MCDFVRVTAEEVTRAIDGQVSKGSEERIPFDTFSGEPISERIVPACEERVMDPIRYIFPGESISGRFVLVFEESRPRPCVPFSQSCERYSDLRDGFKQDYGVALVKK